MNFNRLVSEWAWRVNNGMPDPKNRTHVELLRQVLIESGYDKDWVLEYTQNLFEVDDDKMIKYKQDGEMKTMKAGSAKTMPNDHPAKLAWDELQDRDTTDKKDDAPDPTKLQASDFERKAGEDTDTEQPSTGPTSEQLQNEKDKTEFLGNMVDAILAEDETAGMGAGRYNMSREDLEKYKKYLDGDRPELPNYEIKDEDIDTVLDMIKQKDPEKYKKMRARIKMKGAPPKSYTTGEAGSKRFRNVIKHYLQTGGISVITGERVPFNQAQLDHRVSLDNGGVDGPENWDWMEARFNQFKGALSDEVVMDKIKKELAKSPEEKQLKAAKQELKKYQKAAYIDYYQTSFENGTADLTEEIINGMNADMRNYLMHGWNRLNPKGSEHFIPRYETETGATRASGREKGGRRASKEAETRKIIEKLRAAGIDIPTAKEEREQNEEFDKIKKEIESRKANIGALKKKVKGN